MVVRVQNFCYRTVIPTRRREAGRSQSEAIPGKSSKPYLKNKVRLSTVVCTCNLSY
jgi:hypothetical protein